MFRQYNLILIKRSSIINQRCRLPLQWMLVLLAKKFVVGIFLHRWIALSRCEGDILRLKYVTKDCV